MENKYKLIVFDFDGTLADTQSLIIKTMQMAFEELQLPPRTRQECASTIGLPLTKICGVLYGNDSEELAERFSETYRKHFFRNNVPGAVPAFPEVKDTLEQLKNQGLLLSVATSRTQKSLNMLAEDIGINDLFNFKLGCDDVTNAKPHPEQVLRTLIEFGVEAADTLVVGDAIYDLQMGQAAGAATCGVTYGNGTEAELRSVNPTYIIHRFSQISQIVNCKS